MRRVVTLVAGALLSVACGSDITQGTLRAPAAPVPVGVSPVSNLAIPPTRDARPSIEHEGQENRTRFFFTVGLVTHWERAGNYVTDDFVATANASGELNEIVAEGLGRARVAQLVNADAKPSFTLDTEIVHLYGTHYAVSEGTVVAIPARRGGLAGGGADVTSRQFASYGNVILKAKLIDHRSGQPVVVWEEHVIGTAQAAPTGVHEAVAQNAVRQAARDAVTTLSVRLGAALDRLQQGPSGPAYTVSGQLPPVFLLERVSRYRDFLELVQVDTRSGLVLSHTILPLLDRAYARPGEWLLSRRMQDGVLLSGEGYEAFARALATQYDLRAYDDAYRYHFFGTRGAVAAPTRPPE